MFSVHRRRRKRQYVGFARDLLSAPVPRRSVPSTIKSPNNPRFFEAVGTDNKIDFADLLWRLACAGVGTAYNGYLLYFANCFAVMNAAAPEPLWDETPPACRLKDYDSAQRNLGFPEAHIRRAGGPSDSAAASALFGAAAKLVLGFLYSKASTALHAAIRVERLRSISRGGRTALSGIARSFAAPPRGFRPLPFRAAELV